MNIGIYKPGQGYWVRAMTAVFVGVIALFGAGWAWQQVQIIQLPSSAFQYTINYAGDPIADGTSVEMHAPSVTEVGSTTLIARGSVVGFDRRGSSIASVSVGNILMVRTESPAVETGGEPGGARGAGGEGAEPDAGGTESGSDPESGSGSGSGSGTEEGAPKKRRPLRPDEIVYTPAEVSDLYIDGVLEGRAIDVAAISSVDIVPKQYLQAAAAGLVILLSAGLLYYFVGTHRKSVNFLIETDGEMKKVNWSSRREVIGSTQVVIVAAFLIAAILFGIDNVFSWFFRVVGVLET